MLIDRFEWGGGVESLWRATTGSPIISDFGNRIK